MDNLDVRDVALGCSAVLALNGVLLDNLLELSRAMDAAAQVNALIDLAPFAVMSDGILSAATKLPSFRGSADVERQFLASACCYHDLIEALKGGDASIIHVAMAELAEAQTVLMAAANQLERRWGLTTRSLYRG